MNLIKKLNAILFLPSLFVLFSLPTSALSQESQFLWSTQFSVTQEYDDNVNLESTNPKDDFITTVNWGINLGIKREAVDARADLSIGYAFYQAESENNSYRTNLNLSGFRDIPVAEDITLDLDESLNISEQPVEEDEQVVSVRRGRNRYMRNRTNMRLSYLFGEQDRFYLGYSNILLKNQDPTLADSLEHRPFTGLTHWFNERHGFDVNTSYGKAEYETPSDVGQIARTRSPFTSDFTDMAGSAAYFFRMSPETLWNLTYAISSKDFDDENRTDYQVHNISLGVSHQFTEDLSVSTSAGYYRNEPDQGASGGGFSGNLNVTKLFENSSLSVTGRAGYNEQYFETENLGFSEAKSITATYTYALWEDFNIGLSGSYSENKYTQLNTPRKDKTWQGSLSFSYPILEWLIASLSFSHRDRDSTEADEDYKVNRALLTFTIPYQGRPIDF